MTIANVLDFIGRHHLNIETLIRIVARDAYWSHSILCKKVSFSAFNSLVGS